MKTLTFIVSLLFAIAALQAQDYQISFTGSGQSTIIDSIQVKNLMQGTTLSLNGDDVLHLVGAAGINTLTANENAVEVYPNPIVEFAFVEFTNSKTELVYLEIFNAMGVLISKHSTQVQQGRQRFEISGLKAGIYTINVSSADWKYAVKLISLGNNPENIRIKHLSTNDESAPENALKSIKDLVQMQYNDGEMILFKAFAGNYATVVTLIPAQSQTVNFEFIPCSDADGNNYAVVTIGTQTWMAENLKTTTYRNGNSIPNVTDNTAWAELRTGAYCAFNNDNGNVATFGLLYNWYAAVDSNTIAPEGWHVPTPEDSEILADYLGGSAVAGGKLKKTSTNHWNSPNTGATNETGFTALPGGYRHEGGLFYDLGSTARFWNYTKHYTTFKSYRRLYYDQSSFYWSSGYDTKGGYSVRCLRD